jgi:hypothetical protein
MDKNASFSAHCPIVLYIQWTFGPHLQKSDCVLQIFFLVSHKFSDLLEFREVERCREHALSLVVSLLNELAFSYVTFKAYCWCQETVCLHMLLVLAFCDELMLHPVVY